MSAEELVQAAESELQRWPRWCWLLLGVAGTLIAVGSLSAYIYGKLR